MEFEIDKNEANFVVGAFGMLGEPDVIHEDGVMIANDFSNTRRMIYKPDGVEGGKGEDIAIEPETLHRALRRMREGKASIKTGKEFVEVKFDNTFYKLRSLLPTNTIRKEIKATKPSGTVTIPVKSMKTALDDISAVGAYAVVITAEKGDVWFRSIGSESEGRTHVTDGKSEGMGYSRISLPELIKFVSHAASTAKDAVISLSPKGPTKMVIGNVTYWQAAMA